MARASTCLFLVLIISLPAVTFAQIYRGDVAVNPLYWKNRKPDAAYWQQDVHYTIKASLDETDDRIDGEEQLVYTNNSPDVLDFVYFHLFQNAFIKGSYLHNLEDEKGQKARLGKHEAAGEGTKVENILVDGEPAKTELDNTIMRVMLSKPLQPGRSVTITMKFKTWYDKGTTRRRMKMYDAWGATHYNGCQWFPKLSVYDRKFGWDTYQHLNKEFYGDFGTYDVSLDFPRNYILEATGELTNRNEVLPSDLREKLDVKNFAKKRWDEAPSVIIPYRKGERKTWNYHAEGVHDFAFTADPSYRIGSTTWNGIECVAIVQEPHASGWQHAADYVAKIIQTYSEDIGPYGYPKMVAADAADGMEYPMITLDGGSDPGFHGLLMHEIGHNWFYGMVGSNETYRAAMDEGFTQFLTAWGLRKVDGDTIKNPAPGPKWAKRYAEDMLVLDRTVLNTYTNDALRRDELPLNTHSNDFHDALAHEGGYRGVYYKTASMLYNLQYVLGDSLFQRAMQHYFMQWRFAHPYFEDFRASVIQFTHADLNWFFDEWIETTKTIDYSIEGARRVKGKPDEWAIKFRREGLSQMPIDFTVTAKDGRKQSYYIPNTWFSKKEKGITLGKWWGWSKINPTYTAQITIPSGLRSVQIDTSYRLADADWSNNYYSTGFFGVSGVTRFNPGLGQAFDRRHTRTWIRPDLWWNSVDGVKAGMHIESDYLGVLHKIDATLWWNTHLFQDNRFKPGVGEGTYKHYAPLSYSLNLSSPITKSIPRLLLELKARDLDGLQYLRAGASYKLSVRNFIGFHILSMKRKDEEDLNYLLSPKEWSSIGQRTNSSLNLSYDAGYEYGKGNGEFHALVRAPFLVGNRNDAFNYSFIQVESINTHRLGKLDLRTRLFARYGTGTMLPYESLLFAAGANPEQLMENKYTRSVGFVPEGEDWRGISRFEPTHFQHGGGLNLRGYTGYFMQDTRDGENILSYKGRSGAGVNCELDFDRLIRLTPKLTRNWLHMDAYLFGDAGIMETSRYSNVDFTDIVPTEMWSDVRVDAGLGLAATITRFGPFEQARPLTIRVDFPVFLSRPGYNNPQYSGLRYVVGVERSF